MFNANRFSERCFRVTNIWEKALNELTDYDKIIQSVLFPHCKNMYVMEENYGKKIYQRE